MIIRDAVAADANAVLALWALAGSLPGPTDDRESVENLIAHDPAALLVTEHAGEVTGSLIAGFDGWRGTFFRLAVHPGHRGEGLARRLVDCGRERLEARGAKRISVIVDAHDPRAMAVWKALGYTYEPDRARFRLDC